MTLEEYDRRQKYICDLQTTIINMQREEQRAEYSLYKEADLVCYDREPGFPCWAVKGELPNIGYYNTPRDALESFLRKKESK